MLEVVREANIQGKKYKRTCILGVVKPTAKGAAGEAGPLARLHLASDRHVVPYRVNWHREVDVVDTTRKILRTPLWGLEGRAAFAAGPITFFRALRWLKGNTGEAGNSKRGVRGWRNRRGRR